MELIDPSGFNGLQLVLHSGWFACVAEVTCFEEAFAVVGICLIFLCL